MAFRPATQLGKTAEVHAARAEDRAHWVAACSQAYDKVYRGIVAMGASPADAADAVQDAIARALRREVPGDTAEGWLFVVALRAWKRHSWRQRLFSPLDTHRRATQTHERDDEIALFVELAKLTERQRSVLVARYALGLSQKEIGQILHIAPGTVGAIASQAAKRMRSLLGDER